MAILWLLGYVRRHDYSLFVVYRLLASAAMLLLIITGRAQRDVLGSAHARLGGRRRALGPRAR